MRDCPRCHQRNGLILGGDVWVCHACGNNVDAEVAVPERRSTAGFFRRHRRRRENYCACGSLIQLASIRCRPCSQPKRDKHSGVQAIEKAEIAT